MAKIGNLSITDWRNWRLGALNIGSSARSAFGVGEMLILQLPGMVVLLGRLPDAHPNVKVITVSVLSIQLIVLSTNLPVAKI